MRGITRIRIPVTGWVLHLSGTSSIESQIIGSLLSFLTSEAKKQISMTYRNSPHLLKQPLWKPIYLLKYFKENEY